MGTGVAGSVSHGLTQKPNFIIAKNINGTANDWPVHHRSLTNDTYTVYLNGTASQAAETLIWPSASTNSLMNVGSGAVINEDTKSTILYIWHDVPGLQKFGSYRGSGTADGPYVFTGFRPAIVMVKRYDGGSDDWMIIDDTRDKYNICKNQLYANLVDAAGGGTSASYADTMDLVSTGFKLKYTGSDGNTAAAAYLYAAWSHQALGGLYGGQSNAR